MYRMIIVSYLLFSYVQNGPSSEQLTYNFLMYRVIIVSNSLTYNYVLMYRMIIVINSLIIIFIMCKAIIMIHLLLKQFLGQQILVNICPHVTVYIIGFLQCDDLWIAFVHT